MSFFGSLFTAVSGMSAQSQSTAMISNNIANVDTIGFKGSDAAFYSLVTNSSRLSQYSPGTVTVNRVQNVGLQGGIQQTSSSTDAAVSGNGMFVVKRDDTADQPFLYTRSGSFLEDSTGLLRNSAGFALYGWPLGIGDTLPANQGDLSSLSPVNVAFLGGLTRPTTTANLALNLDADQVNNNPELYSTPQVLPINPNTQQADFTRALTVYDTLGSAQNLTFQFRKIVGPMAHATSNTGGLTLTTSLTDPSVFPNIAAGDEFTVNYNDGVNPPTAQQYIIGAPAGAGQVRIDTVSDLLNEINTNYGGGTLLTATLDDKGRLLIQSDNPTADLSFTNDVNSPLGAGNSPPTSPGTLDFAGQPGNAALSYTPEAALNAASAAYPTQTDFPKMTNVTNPDTAGWWEMTVLKPDGSDLSQGLINFNGDGSLNASPDANGNIALSLSNIDWGNGSDLQNISVDVSKFSQFAGQYNVVSADQNGAALGLRTGVEVTQDGLVVAQFSNGATADLYKLPLATFANVDGLQEELGTAYSETSASGSVNLREAGTGGAGFLQPSAVEGSNVDPADQFSKLIITQRAYTADTRVVSTVDQMTQDLLNLR